MNAASGPSDQPSSDVHRFFDVLTDGVCDSPRETDVRDLRLGARCRQPEKCMRDDPCSAPARLPLPLARRELRIEGARPLDGTFLGPTTAKPAELEPVHANHAALERARKGRVRLNERLGQQVVEPVLRDARDDKVAGSGRRGRRRLRRSSARGASSTRSIAVHPPQRHRTAGVEESSLLLRVHANEWSPRKAVVKSRPGRREGEVRPLRPTPRGNRRPSSLAPG